MPKTIKVTSSPHAVDENLPWEYHEKGFINWVDEVFNEGYKHCNPMPSIDDAIGIVEMHGYTVEVSNG